MERCDLQSARTKAVDLLSSLEEDAGVPLSFFDGEYGVPESEDHEDVWIFNWNSVQYILSGSIFDQILMGPIAVPKDGSDPFLLGTARSVSEELQRWRNLRARGH
ncbi:YrhB domain-containing protein [Nocardia sp. NPDC004654]|uniref:YrhB domain-containing protein n=1 Tax=Nocardia sp. NPDC004654 TaxID=3154776 RepID=UPI0033BC4507